MSPRYCLPSTTRYDLRRKIDLLREEASRLATESNPSKGDPPCNREMLRARLREVEVEIDKLLVQWIEETR